MTTTFLRHPWAVQVILSPGGYGGSPARLHYIESLLKRLRFAGFSPVAASRAYHAIDGHVLGFTLWELGHRIPDDAPDGFVESLLRDLDATEYPFLLEHAHEHLRNDDSREPGEFEFQLDLIFDGLAQLL